MPGLCGGAIYLDLRSSFTMFTALLGLLLCVDAAADAARFMVKAASSESEAKATFMIIAGRVCLRFRRAHVSICFAAAHARSGNDRREPSGHGILEGQPSLFLFSTLGK